MANEDSRENGVVGGALKIAAVGALVYGGYRGHRGLAKHYDDLGSTFLGGIGKEMTEGINKTIKLFDQADGTNAVREALEDTQDKILKKDYTKQLKLLDKSYNSVGLEMSDDEIRNAHNTYNSLSRSQKRDKIKDMADSRKLMRDEVKDSQYDNMRDYFMNDQGMSHYIDSKFNQGTVGIKGTRTLGIDGKEIKKQAQASTQKL